MWCFGHFFVLVVVMNWEGMCRWAASGLFCPRNGQNRGHLLIQGALVQQTLPRQGCNAVRKHKEYFSGKTVAVVFPLEPWADRGHLGAVRMWVCVPAQGLLWLCPSMCWVGFAFPWRWWCQELPGQRGTGGLETRIKEREKPSFKKQTLSHRDTDAGGLAGAYFHPETPPHSQTCSGCVCCWDNIPFPHHPQIAEGAAVEKGKKKRQLPCSACRRNVRKCLVVGGMKGGSWTLKRIF